MKHSNLKLDNFNFDEEGHLRSIKRVNNIEFERLIFNIEQSVPEMTSTEVMRLLEYLDYDLSLIAAFALEARNTPDWNRFDREKMGLRKVSNYSHSTLSNLADALFTDENNLKLALQEASKAKTPNKINNSTLIYLVRNLIVPKLIKFGILTNSNRESDGYKLLKVIFHDFMGLKLDITKVFKRAT